MHMLDLWFKILLVDRFVYVLDVVRLNQLIFLNLASVILFFTLKHNASLIEISFLTAMTIVVMKSLSEQLDFLIFRYCSPFENF